MERSRGPSITLLDQTRFEQEPLLSQDKGSSDEHEYDQPIVYQPISNSELLLVLSTNLVMSIEYAILMPTVWQYLESIGGSKYQLGIAVSSFSITRTIAFVILGLWSDARTMKEPFLFAFIVSIAGNFMYGIAGAMNSVPLLIGGRLVAGVGGGCTALVQAFIARGYPASHRTRLMSSFQGVGLIGILVGPALNFFLVKLDPLNLSYSFFTLNSLTAAGYLMAFVNVIFFFLFLFKFKELPPDPAVEAANRKRALSSSAPPILTSPLMTSSIQRDRKDSAVLTRSQMLWDVMGRRGGWFCLLAIFIAQFEITALETAITPMTKEHYGWKTEENSALFAVICVIAVASIISTVVLDKRRILSSRGLIATSYISVALSFVFGFSLCPFDKLPLYGLSLFGVFFVYGIVMSLNPSTAIYSVKVGEFQKGLFMSYSMLVMGVARAIGPLLAGFAIHFGTNFTLLGVLSGTYLIGVVSLIIAWPKLDVSEEMKRGVMESKPTK